jgi:FHA domain
MANHPRLRLLLFTTLIIFAIVGANPTAAQTASTATLTPPDISAFPHLTTFLDVHDPTGAFVHNLTPQDVNLQENGVQVLAGELQEQKPGVQFVIAITPGAPFTIRDALGVSRYEYLLQGILAGTWDDQPSGVDDLSLLTLGGPQLIHTADTAELRSALEDYQPNDPNAIPSLEVLASALDVAADPTPRPGMERAVLFITPPQLTDVSVGLQSIAASATQQNIRIYVWLVSPHEYFDLPEAGQLRTLAEQTRASFFAFSHDEPVPDLETLLEPLRYVYRLAYDSHIATAGPQQVAAQVTIGTEQVITPVQTFELNLEPPAPSLIDPPAQITRTFPAQPTPAASGNEAELTPTEQLLQVQVIFPDGYDRPLARTTLFVDGAFAAENTSQPFDQFTWDLRPYTQDGVHTLRVEVADSLGLTGESTEVSVQISVPRPTQGVIVAFSRQRLLVAGLIVLLSASVLALVLILGGRIRPRLAPGQVRSLAGSSEKTRPVGYRERMRQRSDPVTQPVKIAVEPPAKAKPRPAAWKDRLPWLQRKEMPPTAIAFLAPLMGSDGATLPTPLLVTAEDVTLGRDPLQSSLVISDPSVEAVHARLHHEGETFLITDAGSVAGTWVNYVLVPPQGMRLEHADIVHIGRVGFRFKLPEPGPLRKVVITPLEPKQ